MTFLVSIFDLQEGHLEEKGCGNATSFTSGNQNFPPFLNTPWTTFSLVLFGALMQRHGNG